MMNYEIERLLIEYSKTSKDQITITKFQALNYSHKIPFNRYIIASLTYEIFSYLIFSYFMCLFVYLFVCVFETYVINYL